ncbi:MAG: hypothetical protein QOJ61_3640, partial [Mycobacterium sp.]|nr:hypothetical protein [Mycobacterium sp.]
VTMARALVAQINDADLVVFDDVGHCPMIEVPARFAAELHQFVGRQA